MKPVLVLLFSALMCASAAAQGIRVDLQDIGERPAELSTAERPYRALLTDSLTRTIADFTNAQTCPAVTARSMAFADVSQLDEMTRQLSRNGGKVYHERVFAEICGAQYMANFYVIARPGQAPVVASGVPGETVASPQLQRDVQTHIFTAARALASCPEPNVIGIAHTLSQSAPADSAWHEEWMVSACGKVVVIPIRFAPAPQGGINYEVRVDAARVN